MSDEENDDSEEIILDPSRQQEIQKDALKNFEILNQKTINFEDLVSELVRRGCLSFEEKFKIMSGVIDETVSNKNTTFLLKCNELYSTLLIRRETAWGKILKCWEETGNSYLVGRFNTHFIMEGRDSKSLKFSKFKALPSNRTEFLTRLVLKNLQLSPKSLLKCLRKSTRLISIRLLRVKLPHGGRYGDDPSSDFELPLILPNLKEFILEEVTKQEPFACIKDQITYLDELNPKPMLFFGLNSPMAWDAGINITFKIRGATILKMQPDWFCAEFISMLRRRAVEYGGFINPQVSKLCLFECYVPTGGLSESISQLVLYRCHIPNFDPFIVSCPNLSRVSFYGEYETNDSPAHFHLNSLKASKGSLKELALGLMEIRWNKNNDSDSNEDELQLTLDSLAIDCCKIDGEVIKRISRIFKDIKKTFVHDCGAGGSELMELLLSHDIGAEIIASDYSWGEIAFETLLKEEKGLKGNEKNFIIKKQKHELDWKVEKCKSAADEARFKAFHWDDFMPFEARKGWFDIPFKIEDSSSNSKNNDINIRKVFRKNQGF